MEMRHENGVTLIELTITVAVMALLAGVALPGFTTILQNNDMSASANELVTALLYTRSEAVKRQAPVSICWTSLADADTPGCGKGEGWHAGWLIFEDGDRDAQLDPDDVILRRRTGLPGRNVWIEVRDIAAPLHRSVTYLPTGFPDFPTMLPGGRNMLLCDGRQDDVAARVVNLSHTGRPRVRERREMGEIGMTCHDR